MFFKLLAIVIGLESISYGWHLSVEQLGASGLYTHQIAFVIIDIIALSLISKYPVRILSNTINAIVCLSIINHTFGAYAYLLYSEPGLLLYDDVKNYIFYSELMAFIIYGMGGGIKRQLRLPNPVSLANIFKLEGNK